MNKKPCFLLALSFLLVACAPPAITGPSPSPTSLTAISPTPPPPGARVILRTSSLSLNVEDPVEALSALEQAVQDAGGFVVSASYYSYSDTGGYASLSARVPPQSLPELRRAALEIATDVESDSVYSQDVTSEYRHLQDRLGQLRETEDQLWQLLTESGDPEPAGSLALLRELIQEETRSVESQLLSYEDRSTLASFDVTLNQILQTSITIE